MNNRPIWLDEYANIIDDIRNKLVQIKVVEEVTLKYAIIRLFARATLSMCEIYTLMNNGYPNGAFSLSRQIYETIVIMNYLTKHQNDKKMIERYFDDIEITKIKIQIEQEKYVKNEIKNSTNNLLKNYSEKYPDFCNTNNYFADYWWVEKGCTFAKLAARTEIPKDYMYKETSCNIHMSSFNSLHYVGSNQNDILIGETYNEINKAGWYSMLCFCMAMDIFRKAYYVEIELNKLISRGQELVRKIN